jgi:hypothetical protein
MELSTWTHNFVYGADLELSYICLDDSRDWFAEGLKGRVASLLLREIVAETHFMVSALEEARATEKNIARALCVDAYAVEHDLYFHGPHPDLIHRWCLPPELPKTRRVTGALRQADAILARVLLSLGDNVGAKEIYEELLGLEHQQRFSGLWLAGLGCAYHNLGLDDSAMQALEDSGVCIKGSAQTLNMARATATLMAIYETLGEVEKAEQWFHFLKSLQCPAKTKEVLLVRAQTMVSRSQAANNLLIV